MALFKTRVSEYCSFGFMSERNGVGKGSGDSRAEEAETHTRPQSRLARCCSLKCTVSERSKKEGRGGGSRRGGTGILRPGTG